MSRHGHILPWGARWLGTGDTHFRLYAPAQRAPRVVVEGREPERLLADGDGFFALMAPAVPGQAYQFQLDDGTRIPDPMSRAQIADVHGPSRVVDPFDYEWQCAGWRGRPWEEAVIYELHVGVCGGFAGVAAQLPALAHLGVTLIELMPVADFPGQRNWGYDGALPFAPDTSYGSPADFKQMIDQAHQLGVGVMLDVVYNHFGPDGNYLHAYAPTFFREDIHTPWGAAIDFRQPEVREYFIHNALYWVHEYRIDGLRFDAVHAIEDPTFLEELARRIRSSLPPDRHVQLVLENERNDAIALTRDRKGVARRYDAQWNDDFHNTVHVLLTGEHEGYYAYYADQPIQRLARCLKEGFVYQGEEIPGQPGKTRGTHSNFLPPVAFVNFLQNHDQVGNRAMGERLVSLCAEDALRAAVLMQLLTPAIPLLFMGEEGGATTPFLFFTDHHDELGEKVREGRRQEFAHFEAFADPERRARIPDPNAPRTFQDSIPPPAAAAQNQDNSWFDYYRTLLQVRSALLVPHLTDIRADRVEVIGSKAIEARWLFADGGTWTLLINLFEEEEAISPPTGDLVFESREEFSMLALGRLPAFYACVLRTPLFSESPGQTGGTPTVP
jgi:maltooligosyltrehalose trehalohydrolase